jgi:phosphatidylserine/phosphatidylglycerophosphate/cardiolipin synthase-like enzyme
LPEIYYDPRSLAIDAPEQSALHAKCVVVDSENVFISSANFTEAAQQRNIEVGLSIRSQSLAEQLLQHFTLLHERNLAMRAL